jgi:hypothetical protein
MRDVITALKAEHNAISEARKKYADEVGLIIDAHHPLKVGSIAKAHSGKMMEIYSVSVYRKGFGGWEWTASGKIRKASGEIGTQQGKWTQEVGENA